MRQPISGSFLLWFGMLGLLFCISIQYYQWRKEKKDSSKIITNDWDKYRSFRMVMAYILAIFSIIGGILLDK